MRQQLEEFFDVLGLDGYSGVNTNHGSLLMGWAAVAASYMTLLPYTFTPGSGRQWSWFSCAVAAGERIFGWPIRSP